MFDLLFHQFVLVRELNLHLALLVLNLGHGAEVVEEVLEPDFVDVPLLARRARFVRS